MDSEDLKHHLDDTLLFSVLNIHGGIYIQYKAVPCDT